MLPAPSLEYLARVALSEKCLLLRSASRFFQPSFHSRCFDHASLSYRLMSLFLHQGCLTNALLVFNRSRIRCASSWNAIIGGCILFGEPTQAFSLYQAMRADSLFPTVQNYVGLLKACAQMKDVDKGSAIHAEIRGMGFIEMDPFVGTALVDMYAKCGIFKKAEDFLLTNSVHNVVAYNALISGYVQHQRYVEALHCFDAMQLQSVSPNEVTFTCILKACSNIGNTGKGVEVHVEISRNGWLGTNAYLGNMLIDMYARNGQIRKAQEVFEQLSVRNVVSWTVLITGYAMNDLDEEAVRWFEDMQLHGVCPNAFTFACILKSCGGIGALDKVDIIHMETTRKGLLGSDPFIGSALVDLYAKWGFLNKAQEIFDSLMIRNVVTWTALISGYAEHELEQETLKHLERMKLESISPNGNTYVSALKACGNSIGADSKGIQIHAIIDRTIRSNTNIILGSALVSMYAKCGMLTNARGVFDMLSARNIVTWSALIMGYAQNGHNREALDCFRIMQEEGVSPNAVSLMCVLKSGGNIVAAEKARNILDMVTGAGFLDSSMHFGSALVGMYTEHGSLIKAREVFDMLPVRNAVTWNVLISGLVQNQQPEEALRFLECMELEGVSPTAATFSCSLRACSHIGCLGKGEKMHAEVARKGLLQQDPVIGSALVDMYSKCGLIANAQEVFDMLPIRNEVTWGALMAGFAQMGEIDNVMSTFERMRGEGWQPDSVTFLCILNACNHAGCLDTGKMFLEIMSKVYAIPWSSSHHACAVDLFGRAGQLNTVTEIMMETPVHPDNVMWLSVLSACRKWGNAELGRHALGQAVQLDANNTAAYVCMYNIAVTQANGNENAIMHSLFPGV